MWLWMYRIWFPLINEGCVLWVSSRGLNPAPWEYESSPFPARRLVLSRFTVWIYLNLSALPTIWSISYRYREFLRVYLIILYISQFPISYHVFWCYKHLHRMIKHGSTFKIDILRWSMGIRFDTFIIVFISHFWIYFNLSNINLTCNQRRLLNVMYFRFTLLLVGISCYVFPIHNQWKISDVIGNQTLQCYSLILFNHGSRYDSTNLIEIQ
jgi:hypothetical protein